MEAFRSTLEEVVDADLLVHVVDGSDVNPLAQINAVRQVVNEVIADHDSKPAPELVVVNKIDAAGDLALATASARAARTRCSSPRTRVTVLTGCSSGWPN